MAKNDKAKSALALTKDAKAVVQLAFEDIGGLPRLVEWANKPANLPIFYTQIWSKIIPRDSKKELTGKDGGPLKVDMNVDNLKGLSDKELASMKAMLLKIEDEPDTEE